MEKFGTFLSFVYIVVYILKEYEKSSTQTIIFLTQV